MSLAVWLFPTAVHGANTIWSSSTVPSIVDTGDINTLELGVRFRSDVAGYITGIRFYKASANTGTHVGHLWTNGGTLLASATFTSETASGWQQVNFGTPVAINANTTYVASYFAPNGHYSLSRPYFTSSYDNAPLHALADGTDGPNGVYYFNGDAFPTGTYQQSNYWVDVVFSSSGVGGSGPGSGSGSAGSLWSTSTVPATADFADGSNLELGVKFYSDVSGSITGLRFYKGAGNTGTHSAHLWSISGKLLASATFSNETASGWQQVTFSSPVSITAGTVYVASYHAPNGNYSLNRPYFTTSYDNPPLHAIASGTNGPNGVYYVGGVGFPTNTYQQSNYWVDVLFSSGGGGSNPDPPPTVSSLSTTSGPTAGGTPVSVVGTNFESGATVTFGGATVAGLTFVSSTQINVITPAASAGTVGVTVTNPGGTSATLANAFTYTAPSGGGGGSTGGSGGSGSSNGPFLVSDGFESGDFSRWDMIWTTTDVTINTNPAFVHSGSDSARIHFTLPADPNSSNRDNNRWFQKRFDGDNGFPTGLTHFSQRGYVYFQTPQAGSDTSSIQRKIYYDKNDPDVIAWSVILTTFNNQLVLTPAPPYDACYQSPDYNMSWNLFQFQYNTWYEVEMEVQLNTPSQRDGYVNVWVNGSRVLGRTGMNLRGCWVTGVTDVEIGDQINSLAPGPMDEYRYWDDVVISNSYIGP